MEQTTERVTLEREIEIAASPDTVWQFLVDPVKFCRWWGTRGRLDARVGGSYRIEVSPGHTLSGEIVEIEPPRRLVYTFGWEAAGNELTSALPPGASTVEIELAPSGGGTRLRLVHRDLPGSGSAAAHGEGWTHYLSRLSVAATGGDPGPDPWAT